VAGQTGRMPLRWPLHCTVDAQDGVPIVVASGRVSYRTAATLAAVLHQVVGDAKVLSGLVLDLQQVDYISSAGLRAIEAALVRLADAKLILVAPPEPVRIAFDLAGLSTRVAIAPSRPEALARIAER